MSVTLKREWIGESGYCNCLLVTMSRLSLPHVELHADQPPPNLEALASRRPSTAAWVRAQEFDYSALDTVRSSPLLLRLLALEGLSGVRLSRAASSRKTALKTMGHSSSVTSIFALVRLHMERPTLLSPFVHQRPNQSMKPTAPLRNEFSVFATTPCRGLSLSR